MAKLWYQNQWAGGDGIDNFVTAPNQVLFSKNMDFRTNQKAAKLSIKSQSYLTTTALGNKIICVGGYIITFANDGKVYVDNSTTAVWTNTGNASTKNACIFDDRVYWIYGDRLNSIAISNVGGAWTNGVTVNEGAYPQQVLLTSSAFSPMKVAYNSILYIGNGYRIVTVNTGASTYTTAGFQTIKDDTITAFTLQGNYLKVYTAVKDYQGTSVYYSGRLYYWDLVLNNAIDIVPFNGLPVRNAIEYGSYDYVIAGVDDATRPYFSTGLYISSGRDLQLVRQFNQNFNYTNLWYLTNKTGNPYPLYLDKNILYIGTYGGIITYGTNKPGYPQTWTQEYLPSAASGDIDPNCIIGDITVNPVNNNIITSWHFRSGAGATSYGVDSIDVSKPITYADLGEFYTAPIYIGMVGATKGNIELYVGHGLLNEGEKIDIYYRLNNYTTGSLTLLQSIDSTNSIDSSGNPTLRTVIPIQGDWNYVQFRVRLTPGTSNLTTPELYDLALFYDDNIKY